MTVHAVLSKKYIQLPWGRILDLEYIGTSVYLFESSTLFFPILLDSKTKDIIFKSVPGFPYKLFIVNLKLVTLGAHFIPVKSVLWDMSKDWGGSRNQQWHVYHWMVLQGKVRVWHEGSNWGREGNGDSIRGYCWIILPFLGLIHWHGPAHSWHDFDGGRWTSLIEAPICLPDCLYCSFYPSSLWVGNRTGRQRERGFGEMSLNTELEHWRSRSWYFIQQWCVAFVVPPRLIAGLGQDQPVGKPGSCPQQKQPPL